MKFNTTYTQKIGLKDTIVATSETVTDIKKLFNEIAVATDILLPQFLDSDSELLINNDRITRQVTFDTSHEYKTGALITTHSNWLRQMIYKLELDEGEGLYSEAQSVWRDLPMSPVSSISKNSLIFQMKVKENDEEIVNDITRKLYNLIIRSAEEFSKQFNLENIYNDKETFITSQALSNEFPNLSPKERELEFSKEYNSFVLVNAGDTMFSGHRHSYIPEEIYSQKEFNQIVIKDNINAMILKVASIAKIARGQLLSDQLTMNDKNYLKETEFFNNEIKGGYDIVEIKVNIGRLMMALLQKGHISETEPGNFSSETDIIRERKDIEIY